VMSIAGMQLRPDSGHGLGLGLQLDSTSRPPSTSVSACDSTRSSTTGFGGHYTRGTLHKPGYRETSMSPDASPSNVVGLFPGSPTRRLPVFASLRVASFSDHGISPFDLDKSLS